MQTTRGTRKTILFVLAHQDDEVMHSTRIEREVARGNEVHCVFLTDGDASGRGASVRDAESRAVLTSLGVPEECIHFLGSEHGIADGSLVDHLPKAYRLLAALLGGRRIDRVYAMAWEGGHADHDAAHILALALAERHGALHRCWQIPVYHGHLMPWGLYRVLSLLPARRRPLVRKMPLREAFHHAMLGFRYRSQWKTWLAIMPEFLVRRLIQRREVLAAVDPAALNKRPHEGALFYETRFGVPYDRFALVVAGFLEEHLG
jgi:LmbE family N-acetylglucosaminyl deacetylase